MKIRHKITMGISVTALLAALSLASFIFFELLEEPLQLIDRELAHVGNAILDQGVSYSTVPWQLDTALLPHSPDEYWIRVYNQEKEVLYESKLTKFVEIPKGKTKHRRYNVELVVPSNKINIGQDVRDGVVFRVRTLRREIDGQPVVMRIAKSIEQLEEDLITVMHEATFGVLIFIGLLIVASYYLAGKILQPVVTMTELARKISEDSLDQRIPLGKNKDELASLAKALNRMFDGLQYSFDRQKAFISNGSHELKSPITRLLLSQDELLQNPELPETIRDDLDRQHNTMRWMKKLVQNLLNLSRLEEQETLTLEPLDLTRLISEVLENYKEMLDAKGIKLRVDLSDNLCLQGDSLHLQRLFINLIDNGIRYNDPEQGRLTITGRKSDGMCIIDIDNAGQSISNAEHELIFEQFYRVEQSRSTRHGGVGLGLTMCRKIVELHGGQIQVQSGVLGGTQFRVIIPA